MKQLPRVLLPVLLVAGIVTGAVAEVRRSVVDGPNMFGAEDMKSASAAGLDLEREVLAADLTNQKAAPPPRARGRREFLHPVPCHAHREGPNAIPRHREGPRHRHSLAKGAALSKLSWRRSDRVRDQGPSGQGRLPRGQIARRHPGILRQLPRQHRVHAALSPVACAPTNSRNIGPAGMVSV